MSAKKWCTDTPHGQAKRPFHSMFTLTPRPFALLSSHIAFTNPAYLATLVFIGSNRKVYMPSKKDIFQRYLRKFTKGGKLLEADLGLATQQM